MTKESRTATARLYVGEGTFRDQKRKQGKGTLKTAAERTAVLLPSRLFVKCISLEKHVSHKSFPSLLKTVLDWEQRHWQNTLRGFCLPTHGEEGSHQLSVPVRFLGCSSVSTSFLPPYLLPLLFSLLPIAPREARSTGRLLQPRPHPSFSFLLANLQQKPPAHTHLDEGESPPGAAELHFALRCTPRPFRCLLFVSTSPFSCQPNRTARSLFTTCRSLAGTAAGGPKAQPSLFSLFLLLPPE